VSFSQGGNILFVTSFLETSVYSLSDQSSQTTKYINGGGNGVSSSSDGKFFAVSNARYDAYKGRVQVYRHRSDDSWEQMGSSLFGPNTNELFGEDIAMSRDGHTLAVGTGGINAFNGNYVNVYKWNGADWVLRGDTITGAEGSLFGYAVSVTSDGNIIAIGAFIHEYVEIYKWGGSGWILRGKRLDIIRSTAAWFGNHLDISSDGTVLAIGAPKESNKKGRVYIYDWDGKEYTLRSSIWGLEDNNEAGWSVSISGNGLVLSVGTWSDKSDVRVFEWHDSTSSWVLRLPRLNGGDWTHIDSTDDGNTLVVGLPNSDEKVQDSGKVTIYKWTKE